MADVVERLPYPISKRLATAIEDVLAKNGREIHFTIGGIPFRLHATTDTPVQLDTAQIQKNQQDTEPEAGEQTLAGWWLRSQASWHQGAGYRYAETRGEVKESNFFLDSLNVDVWTQGQVSLLRKAVEVSSSSNRSVAMVPANTLNQTIVGQAGSVKMYEQFGGGLVTNLYSPGGISFDCVVATETLWFASGDNGKVYSADWTAGLTTAPKVWSLTGADLTKPTRIAWAKHRLWAINGNKIYWINYATSGTVAAPVATDALYTHPSPSWVYSDIADVPGGVLFSGYGDGSSHLQRVTLDTDGAAPTMAAATTTAILPSDERALRINSLTGSLVCILTSKGVRVAQASTSGELVYGPLFLERDTDLSPSARPALTSAGRFWWLSWGDSPMVYRVDSSVQPEDGVFAYATDMNLPTATGFTGIAVRGERPVVVTSSGALVYQHATQLEAEGWIQSGRIRYRTEEPKLFQFIDISAAPLRGVISLDVLNEADSGKRIGQYTVPGMGALPTAQIPADTGPLRFMSLKLTLTRAGDGISGPEVHGWQVKALPAGKPQRLYQLPLKCYDRETWTTGYEDPYGYVGYGHDRYYALRAAEDSGGVVMLRDYRFASPQGELCKIEGMRFVQTSAGNPSKQQGVFEGILIVTLRTLT
jgi:hypothetical protein